MIAPRETDRNDTIVERIAFVITISVLLLRGYIIQLNTKLFFTV